MEIKLSLEGQTLTATAPTLAGESLKKVFCSLAFDEHWDGLAITLVFRNVCKNKDDACRSVLVTNYEAIEVPHEVLRAGMLYIGAVGVAENGTVRLTTAQMNYHLDIREAEDADAEESESVTPSIADQIVATIGSVSNLTTAEKGSLVGAINEIYANMLSKVHTHSVSDITDFPVLPTLASIGAASAVDLERLRDGLEERLAQLSDINHGHIASEIMMNDPCIGGAHTNNVQEAIEQIATAVDGIATEQPVNVKSFGAIGDGTADDANAIQAALDSCAVAGGIIYFPQGTYRITHAVKFYNNQTLFFAPNTTLLQGAAINNLMRNYCLETDGGYDATHDVQIIGATFDGGDWEENNTLLGFTHCKNVLIKNCKFVNGYGTWHNIECNSSVQVEICNSYFEGHRRTSNNAEMIQLDALTLRTAYPWEGAVDSTPCKSIKIHDNVFDCTYTAIGHHNTDVAVKDIEIYNNMFTKVDVNNGAGYGIYMQRKGAENERVSIHGNSFSNFQVPIYLMRVGTLSVFENRFHNDDNELSGIPVIFIYYGRADIYSNYFSGRATAFGVSGENQPLSQFHDNVLENVSENYIVGASTNCNTRNNLVNGVFQAGYDDYINALIDERLSANGGRAL